MKLSMFLSMIGLVAAGPLRTRYVPPQGENHVPTEGDNYVPSEGESSVPNEGVSSVPNGRAYAREFYTLFTHVAFDTRPPTSALYVEAFLNGSQIEQVAVWRDIPQGVTTCSLKWSQAAKRDRQFMVKGNGYVTAHVLTGFPQGEVNYDSITPFAREASRVGASDFTNWDVVLEESDHIVSTPFPCHSQVYVKFAMANYDPEAATVDDAMVYLQHDERNGFYLEYNL